jgi:branched-chain amino acid transport system permease protein
MTEFGQFLFDGIVIGAVYALVALGFSITFRTTGVVNFAQGSFVMVGGLTTAGLTKLFDFPVLAAAAVALVVATVVGVILGAGVRAMAGATEFRLVLVTLATALGLQALALLAFGPDALGYESPFTTSILRLGDVTVVAHSIIIVATTLVLMTGLVVFLKRTRWGRAMVATSIDREAASSLGVNIGLVVCLAFGLSAALGAVGGFLLTPLTATSAGAGLLLTLKGFAGAVLGGMSSPGGAVAGGFLIGVIEALGTGYLSSGYKNSIALVVLLLVLLVRPQGIFGRRLRVA